MKPVLRSPIPSKWLPCAALLGLLCASPLHADWREDLLKERGIGLDKASLEQAARQGQIGNQAMEDAFAKLGADEFQIREQAQKVLSDAGEAVLDFLDSKEPIEDPEVRVRVGDIRKSVQSGVRTRIAPLVRLAAKSLLEKPKDPKTGGHFYEWFATEQKDCTKSYRLLAHGGADSFHPFVKGGKLHIPGKHGGEEDQRFSLMAKDWPGGETFPDRFKFSCLLGGEAGGAGAFHVALSVGKVKALFHPGYRGGGFRFEQAGTLEKYSENQDMGFTPEPGKLYRMDVSVARFPSGRVGLKVMVTSPEGKTFETHVQVDGEEVGPIDRISMERSGRRGGDGIFDDLQVTVE